ncbi:hypothetical protein B0T25DRAFT_552431 [Lasiosphaeria hispida]|uniref:Uncharacterized protein n=1 Tax=Lasiosphaeria hispida TaxID=260671 RepID=A0AAJ0HC54_9PEZI|nr:hypothetical protein B0T25DRAFT_552431 [Lasiosphaeria hispida]
MAQSQPIYLFGFDFGKQERLKFNHSWSAAFLTPKFTNEEAELLQISCYKHDGLKKREVKYGNNVTVLFEVLSHIRDFYHPEQEWFWQALCQPKGFNTNIQLMQDMVNILTEARRVFRRKGSRDKYNTALAADRWIDFLDNRKVPAVEDATAAHHEALYKFRKLERTMVNSANIPLDISVRGLNHFNTWRPGSDPSPTNKSLRGLPPLKTETADRAWDGVPREPRSARKRSPSPFSSDQSPRLKKSHHGSGPQPQLPITQQQSPQQPKLPTPTHTIRRQSIPNTPIIALQLQRKNSDEISDPSRQLLEEDHAMLRSRVSTPNTKTQLVETSGQPNSAAAIDGLASDVRGVREEVKSMESILGNVVESMHHVADHLHDLNTKQDITALLQPIQALDGNVAALRGEVSDLKIQAQQQQKQQAAELNSDLQRLFMEQNIHINKLAGEVSRMQGQLGSSGSKPTPQNLRQAMAAAEQDLMKHRDAIQTFYHEMSGTSSRAVTEDTADFLLTLEQGLMFAQRGKQG